MVLRSLVPAAAAALILAAPAPALASDGGPGRMAERLNDPQLQRSMAGALAAMTEAMMSIDLAPFARAMDAAGDHRSARRLARHSTVRELAGRDAERIPAEMERRVPQMMGMMVGMAGAMEQMLPELQRMGERMGAAIRDADPDRGDDVEAERMPDSEPAMDDSQVPAAGEATEE